MNKALLVDLDGTLSDSEWRVHFIKPPAGVKKNWPAFFGGIPKDNVVPHILKIVRENVDAGVQVIFFTARPDWTRDMTEKWLKENVFVGMDYPAGKRPMLVMRNSKDHRPDFVVKPEMYELHVKGKWEVVALIDDKQEILDAFHKLGIPALHPDTFAPKE